MWRYLRVKLHARTHTELYNISDLVRQVFQHGTRVLMPETQYALCHMRIISQQGN